jgi:hypothetical protein
MDWVRHPYRSGSFDFSLLIVLFLFLFACCILPLLGIALTVCAHFIL